MPYGQVWRLGANEATTIAFSGPVKVEGKDVPAGTYALFAIPGKDKWTFILNKTAKQWGAFKYQQSEDLLRFDVAPQPGNAVEMMTFSIVPKGPASASVEMEWAKVKTAFNVTGAPARRSSAFRAPECRGPSAPRRVRGPPRARRARGAPAGRGRPRRECASRRPEGGTEEPWRRR